MDTRNGEDTIKLRFIACLIIVGSLVGPSGDSYSAGAHPPGPRAASAISARRIGQPSAIPTKLPSASLPPPARYDITLPVLKDPSRPDVARQVNAELQDYVTREVTRTVRAEQHDYGPQDTVSLSSSVRFLGSGIYSIEMQTAVNGPGRAHPAEYVLTRNYWLRNGRPLALADLFLAPKAKLYSGIIEINTEDQLRGQTFDDPQPASGDFGEHYLISKDGLRFVFAPCDIGPCSAGYLESEVGYRELARYIDPDGPIGALR
jgi:hypothetical protein